jgi:hypothetical protein
MTKVVRIKSSMRVEDYFERTKAKRDFLAREKQCAEDVAEVLSFEVGFSRHAGGLPPMAVLLAAWRRARDSWKALPLDSPLREEMQIELAAREKAMDDLARKAEALLEGKANGHG